MKNLANCTPSEFIAQTVKIKKVAQDWMDATKVIEILRVAPVYKTLPAGATAEERAQVIRENAKLRQDQGLQNFSRLFDAAFEMNAPKTLEILALCCFVEPQDVDSHPMNWYLESITELIHEKAILDFFSSLAQLAQKNTSKQ
jgi:hypothetical protein